MHVHMYEFADDNKQEILEPKLFSIFCYFSFKWIIFAVEVLESKNEIFEECYLDVPVLSLVAILKSIIDKLSKNIKGIHF